MNFVVGLPRTSLDGEFVMVVVDYLSKMMHFICFHKIMDALHMTDLYFKVVRLDGLKSETFMSN